MLKYYVYPPRRKVIFAIFEWYFSIFFLFLGHCTEQEEHHKLDESLCVLSSSNLDIKDDVIRIIKAESEVNKDSLEPVKPPRLKKLARIQQQQKQELQQKNNKELQEIIEETNGGQQNLKRQASKDSLEQHLKDRMKKISHMDQNRYVHITEGDE